MKVLIALTTGIIVSSALAAGVALPGRHATPAASTAEREASSQPASHGGTIVVIHPDGTGASLITRDGTGRLARTTVGPRSKLTASDGQSLQQTSIRLGDLLTIRAGGQIEDLSQRTEDLQALVSVAPTPYDGPMVVVMQHSRDLAVDLSSQTRYHDSSHETSSPVGIVDGDLVRIRGVVDRALGEMTQTLSISRLGPYLSRPKGHPPITG